MSMWNHTSINTKKNKKSFTLAELLTAGSLFIVFLTLVIQIYLQTLKNHRLLISISEVSDNIGFAIEKMNREIRVGKDFSISINKDKLSFTSEDDKDIVYRFNTSNNSIERSEDGGLSFENLTGENVIVESLKFYGNGFAPGDNLQPRITILLKFKSKEAKKESEKYFTFAQTTVSSRLLQVH